MEIDPVATAGLVAREIRTGERDGVTTRVVVARRSYETDQGDLWHAITEAERIPRWFLPVSGELRPGAWYQLEGNAGGVIEVCDAPDYLAVTWTLSPPGIEFVRRAASGWADAAVADGDDPAAAHAATERTVAFYTTVPDG